MGGVTRVPGACVACSDVSVASAYYLNSRKMDADLACLSKEELIAKHKKLKEQVCNLLP